MGATPNRVTWLTTFAAAGLLLLGGQLYRLTVVDAAYWRAQADQNTQRVLPMYGPRGAIYDGKGRALAVSEPAFAAILSNQDEEQVKEMLPKLALILANGDQVRAGELVDEIKKRYADRITAGLQYEPMVVARKLSQETVTMLIERRSELPGVSVVAESTRQYPQQKLAGALVGYVGQIDDEQLNDSNFDGYHLDEIVGKAGLEQFYEAELRGKPGKSAVLVDPSGRRVGDFNETPAVPGSNLYVTLDAELQRVAEVALSKQIAWMKAQNNPKVKPVRGALVVQDVRTGAVLAMASIPTYDPNMMIRGMTPDEWKAMQEVPGSFFNWGIKGFAPGSTFKMATGLAGLESGVVGSYEQISCPAVYWRYGGPKNWKPYDDGPTDISRALATSCNPYFFELGHRMGIQKMHDFYAQFGFGELSGIDLPDEEPGINPTEESYGNRWYPGQVVNVAIGQGDVLVTPLQLANYVATVAMSGVRYRPYLVSEIRSASGEILFRHQPEELPKVQASAQSWQRVQQGMRLAVTSSEGTAHQAFIGFPIPVAGKTGSAETGSGYAHALSVAYAPADNPEIAVSIVVEGGSTGSWTTPVIRRVMAKYFGLNDVIPGAVPTYRD